MQLNPQLTDRLVSFHASNLRIWKDGELRASWDLDQEIRRNQYSVTKSFTAVAVGLAIREGLLELDETVIDLFPDRIPEHPSENLKALKLRHLLSMQCGFSRPLLMAEERMGIADSDWVRYVFSQPFSERPGGHFLYTNAGPYLAGLAVQRRSGCRDLVDYLMPRLFQPLGFHRPSWECDPDGHSFGAGGIFLSVSEIGRFGLLLLNGGVLDGRELIPASWIGECRSKRTENGKDPYGYGYGFWLGPHGTYRADGKYGQFSIVAPHQNAVIALNAECRDQDALLAVLHDLIPSL